MPVVFANKSKIIFFLCLLLFVSCRSATEKDTESLKKDATATAELNRVNQMLARGQYLSQNDIDSLNKIREKYPSAPVVRTLLQGALVKREDWQTAADVITQIPDGERTDEEKVNLAKIYIKLGRYEDALNTVNPLLEKNPANVELVSLASNSLLNLGRYDEAGQRLDQVWTQIVGEKRFDETTMRGLIYFYQKNYAKAVETLTKSLEFNPDNVSAFNLLARVYAAQGDNQKAEEYTKKMQLGMEKMTAEKQKKARFLESAKNLERAFNDKRYEEVVMLAKTMIPEAETPNKFALYQYLASAYQALGKPADAQNALAEAEKLKIQK